MIVVFSQLWVDCGWNLYWNLFEPDGWLHGVRAGRWGWWGGPMAATKWSALSSKKTHRSKNRRVFHLLQGCPCTYMCVEYIICLYNIYIYIYIYILYDYYIYIHTCEYSIQRPFIYRPKRWLIAVRSQVGSRSHRRDQPRGGQGSQTKRGQFDIFVSDIYIQVHMYMFNIGLTYKDSQ